MGRGQIQTDRQGWVLPNGSHFTSKSAVLLSSSQSDKPQHPLGLGEGLMGALNAPREVSQAAGGTTLFVCLQCFEGMLALHSCLNKVIVMQFLRDSCKM